LNSTGTGSTYTAISAEQVKNINIAFPSLEEQNQIAAYLDSKTEKIDKLITTSAESQ